MGKLYLAIEEVLKILKIPYLLPSLPGPLALELGKELAPEDSNLPSLLVLGNMREALDKGADTLLILGGTGSCHFGNYARQAAEILLAAGYKFRQLRIDQGHHREAYQVLIKDRNIRLGSLLSAGRQGWQRVICAETLACLEQEYLPQATEPDKFLKALGYWRQEMNLARSVTHLVRLRSRAIEYVKNMSLSPKDCFLRVALIGDTYTLLEPFANCQIEDYLLSNQVSVYKDISVSSWLPNAILPWRKQAYSYGIINPAGHDLHNVDGTICLSAKGSKAENIVASILANRGEQQGLPVLNLTPHYPEGISYLEKPLENFLITLRERKKVQKSG